MLGLPINVTGDGSYMDLEQGLVKSQEVGVDRHQFVNKVIERADFTNTVRPLLYF